MTPGTADRPTVMIWQAPEPELADLPRTQRRHPRYPCRSKTVALIVAVDSPDSPWQAVARDASVSGLGLVCDRLVWPDTRLVVTLRGPRGLAAVEARVAHSTQLDDGSWLVGCRFPQPISEGRLAELL